MKPIGIIIAGGQSRRFNLKSDGQLDHIDKFLAPFGETTLLDHIITRAKKQVSPLLLNMNGDAGRVSSYGIDVFADNDQDMGPLGGIWTAMMLARERGFSHIMTFSGDSPFFPDDYAARLCQAVNENDVDIAICQSQGATKDDLSGQLHPVMGIFAASLADDLKSYMQSGERRVMWWIRQHSFMKVVWEEKDPDPFFNINSRQDLAQAEKYAK